MESALVAWPSCPILPPLITDESTGGDGTAEPSINPDEPGSLDTAMVIMAEGLTTLHPTHKKEWDDQQRTGINKDEKGSIPPSQGT